MNLTFIPDWLSFTDFTVDFSSSSIHEDSPKIFFDVSGFIQSRLGLDPSDFKELPGINGHKSRWYSNGISVHTPSDGPLCSYWWVEISGTGMRFLEDHSSFLQELDTWFYYFSYLSNIVSFTRLDIAADIKNGLLPMSLVYGAADYHNYVTRWKTCKLIRQDDAGEFYDVGPMTVYFGSNHSDILLRFYDKGAERGFDRDDWTRCELQLRRDRCREFLDAWSECASLGEAFVSVLVNYLRFVDPSVSNDSNRWRWPMLGWWSDFIGSAKRRSLCAQVGSEYNIRNLLEFSNQFKNAVLTLRQLLGDDEAFFRFLEEKTSDRLFPKKYKDLLKSFFEGGGYNFPPA